MSKIYLSSATSLTKMTTIRLTPENRLFIEAYARQMNISINSLINKLIKNSIEFGDFIPAEYEETEKEEVKSEPELRVIGTGHWRPIYCKELDIEFPSKRHCARFFRMSKVTLDKAIEKGHYYSPKLGKIVTFEYVTHY